VGKIIGAGLYYEDHAAESGMAIPQEPALFLKPTSATIGPNDDVEIPLGSEKQTGRSSSASSSEILASILRIEQALDHVADYCIVNDVSERAYQLERGGQWDKGKGCDTFAQMGPWLVTPDEVGDPQELDLWLEVDGQRLQRGNTRT